MKTNYALITILSLILLGAAGPLEAEETPPVGSAAPGFRLQD